MISVIIPVYEQYRQLEYTLMMFSKQKDISNFEIVIVDDASSFIQYDVIDNARKVMNWNKIKFIRNDVNMGRSFTRNVGINNSDGDILIFCDADRYPSESFLYEHNNMLNTLSDKQVISIGNVIEDFSKNPYDSMKKKLLRQAQYYKLISNLFDEMGVTESNIPWIATLSGNMGIKGCGRSFLFDESFKTWGFEHFEFGYRLFKAGFKFYLNSKAENYHIVHRRESQFYEKSIQKSLEVFLNKHPEKDIEFFSKFITGEISLQDFEKEVGGKAEWIDRLPKLIYNKIFSC